MAGHRHNFSHGMQQWGQSHECRAAMHDYCLKAGFDHLVARSPGMRRIATVKCNAPFPLRHYRQRGIDLARKTNLCCRERPPFGRRRVLDERHVSVCRKRRRKEGSRAS